VSDPLWRPPMRAGRPAVACVGETMVSFIPAGRGALDTAASAEIDVAGAESNVAMYLADHGVDARWISRLGDDAFGRRVLDRVRASGVDVSGVRTDPERPTGLLFKDPAGGGAGAGGSGAGAGGGGTVVTYRRAGSAASAMGPDVLREEAARTADLWHLTGITPGLSEECRALVEAAVGAGRTQEQPGRSRPAVSFDVNYRPAVWRGRDPGGPLRRLAQAADIVFVGLDEAQALWGHPIAEAQDVRTLLPGPRILVVKDGATQATAFFGRERVIEPALRVDVVEPVGAGDAFAAGFLAALLQGRTAQRCLRSGHLTAAAALSVTGDHGPLPAPEVFAELLDAPSDRWHAHKTPAMSTNPRSPQV
jgi:2-dehydro-3-deoxygluconokinase